MIFLVKNIKLLKIYILIVYLESEKNENFSTKKLYLQSYVQDFRYSLSFIFYIPANSVVIIGITIANNIVLVVTTFVAYSTSPFASLTKIGNTARAGAAD